MRFGDYLINEETEIEKWERMREMLERNCQPYIKLLKSAKDLLKRGMASRTTDMIDKVPVRMDRQPRFIDPSLARMLDAYSKREWGFKARSQGVFASKDSNVEGYGNVYVVFPIGDFKYAWTRDAGQIYYNYDHFQAATTNRMNIENRYSESLSDEIHWDDAARLTFKDEMEPELKKYKTNNLRTYLRGPKNKYSECIFTCKEYYIIHREWTSTLKGWFTDKYWKR